MQLVTKKLIGRGNYGETFQFISADGTIKAAKFFYVHLRDYHKDRKVKFLDLLKLQKELDHPAILKVYEVFPQGHGDDKRPAILINYFPNDTLEETIPNMDSTNKLINIYGLAEAMKYLHQNDILHYDLKTSNILENENFYPKLKDVQFSTCTQGLSEISQTHPISPFIVPEQFIDKICKVSEVFSYGLICYHILTGKKLFQGLGQVKRARKLLNGERPELPDDLEQFYKFLIQKCWEQKT